MNFGLAYSTWDFLLSEEELCSMQFVTAVNFLTSCILNIIISWKMF
jgi:hypothetical protein